MLSEIARGLKNKLLPFIDRRRLVLVSLFVTGGCNLTCKHCFYCQGPSSPAVDELTLEEYRRISEHMPDFPWLIITGGEPFLRRDVAEITRLFIENNNVTNVTLPSNGLFPERLIEWLETVDAFDRPVSYNINLSLYGPEAIHESITGIVGSYRRTIETARLVRDRIKTLPMVRLVFSLSMMRDNQEHLMSLVQVLEAQFPECRINLGLVRGSPREPQQADVSSELYRTVSDHLLAHPWRDGRGPFTERFFSARDRIMHDRIFRIMTHSAHYRPCLAGKLSLVISEKGDLFVCELLEDSLGNLRNVDYCFSKLWETMRRRDILARIDTTRCTCTHECNLTVNGLYDYAFLPATLAAWLRRPKAKK